MARSMTGYGRAEMSNSQHKFTVELKSVNNRYLDLSIRLPRQLNCFEADIRREIQKNVLRGKVDVYIGLENLGGTDTRVCYNRALAGEYVSCMREMAKEYGLPLQLTAEQLAQYPEVLTIAEGNGENEELLEPLLDCVREAVKQFVAARGREGDFITEDLLGKLDEIYKAVCEIRVNAPVILEQYRKGLFDRMQEVLKETPVDETRILQEAAFYADKVCVDEELVRLESHIHAVRAELLKRGESVGRKLDFLVQEMNREANTILSKTSNAQSADIAIQIKTDIEKIREQIQNVE